MNERPFNWAESDFDEDWPPPAEERTQLVSARPRVRFCRARRP